MRKNTKIILTSLALLASTSVLAPVSVVSAADQPTATVATQNNDLQTITMSITKSGSTTPSEAAMFLGNSAQVSVKDGKVTQVIIHVDGSKSQMTKGQDMSKMVASLTLNGVAGKQENVAKDGSSLDYVFSGDAYKEGAGSLECSLNVMGKTMDEKADVTLGKIAASTTDANKDANTNTTTTNTNSNADTATDSTNTSSTTSTPAVKKISKKAKAVKRTLKHNAYVYKKNGKRANKKILKKGHRVNTYGRAIKLHGKTFYRISKNTYVKKANF